MSAPEGRDPVFTAVSSTWGAVASVWGLATYCDGVYEVVGTGTLPSSGCRQELLALYQYRSRQSHSCYFIVFSLFPTSALSLGLKCNFIEFCHVITWAGCGLLLLPAFLLAFDHF